MSDERCNVVLGNTTNAKMGKKNNQTASQKTCFYTFQWATIWKVLICCLQDYVNMHFNVIGKKIKNGWKSPLKFGMDPSLMWKNVVNCWASIDVRVGYKNH